MTSKRRKWLLLLTCVLALTALAVFLAREREPSYEGKSLSEWVEIHDDDCSYVTCDPGNQPASNAIRQIGTNALPYLLKWVSYDAPNSGTKKFFAELLGKLPDGLKPRFIVRWADSDFEGLRASYSTRAFSLFRDESRLCIPRLVELMNNTNLPHASYNASLALGFIGPDAMPIFAGLLARTNTPIPVRMNIATAGRIAAEQVPSSASTVEVLARCAKDPDPRVRESGIRSLGRIGRQNHAYASIAVPVLTNCLRDDLPATTQYLAVRSLTVFSNDACVAVPLLLNLINSTNPGLRMGATNALRYIAPEVLSREAAKLE